MWDEGGMDSFDDLLKQLGDEDADVRVRLHTLSKLGRIGDARAIELLIATLSDVDARLRSMSARMLEGVGEARGVTVLIAALRSADASSRPSLASPFAATTAARFLRLFRRTAT
jgi:HEAT repeat protein